MSMGKIIKDLNFTSDIDIIIFDSKNSPYSILDFNQSVKKLISDLSNISLNFFHKIDLRLRARSWKFILRLLILKMP